jgi:excisionase family DNA binding protein
MFTVSEAARLIGKNPETIRRWIRSGRLKAQQIGTRHMIEERDLESLFENEELPVPPAWARMPDGRAAPNVVRAIRLSRIGR